MKFKQGDRVRYVPGVMSGYDRKDQKATVVRLEDFPGGPWVFVAWDDGKEETAGIREGLLEVAD